MVGLCSKLCKSIYYNQKLIKCTRWDVSGLQGLKEIPSKAGLNPPSHPPSPKIHQFFGTRLKLDCLPKPLCMADVLLISQWEGDLCPSSFATQSLCFLQPLLIETTDTNCFVMASVFELCFLFYHFSIFY